MRGDHGQGSIAGTVNHKEDVADLIFLIARRSGHLVELTEFLVSVLVPLVLLASRVEGGVRTSGRVGCSCTKAIFDFFVVLIIVIITTAVGLLLLLSRSFLPNHGLVALCTTLFTAAGNSLFAASCRAACTPRS